MKTINLLKASEMKLFYVLTIALVVQSCDSDNEPDPDLIGQWLLFERFDGDGIHPVNTAKTITFKVDGTFKGSFVPGCDGTFSVDKNLITISRRGRI